VAITVEPQKSGLEFYPDLRTLSDVIYSDANGKLDCDRSQPVLGNPFLASVNPGDALIFRDDVLHSGAVNQGSFTRSSIEITFV
jgi:ectoine hydroxylase-related dioxygenase (phytanoyl-CoA dioxygenase family)